MESCAIESASRQNPDKQILVYSNGFQDLNVKRLGSNIEVRRFSYREEFSKASRELSEWYASGKYREGFCVNNMMNRLRTNEDIVGLHLWASQIRAHVRLESSRKYRSDAVLWDVFEMYCPRTSDLLLPSRRGDEQDEKQFNAYVVSPLPGQQYYGQKKFQVNILIRASEDVEETKTCVCVDLEYRMPVEVNEENERQVKNSCFPWTRLDLVFGVRVPIIFFWV